MASLRTSTFGWALSLYWLRTCGQTFEPFISQVDREKVLKSGRDVVGKLLVELQVRKSTADGPGTRDYYTKLTTPLPGWDGDIRDLVLKKKLVRVVYSACSKNADFLCYSRGRFSCSLILLLWMEKYSWRSILLLRQVLLRVLSKGSSSCFQDDEGPPDNV